ncbi:MAG: tRNA (adenosine(37)-N6)-threonylcarbamoyltransferase complex ATPase subunit type 1 TsaE [Candidatus Caenarcaniphilales bacterium]|nr:tRNA (adenosine(37)-N6)-threonylcarbamoyltransferase complex ATPase subunit type 1 TsaE [Candidatus Caenarcaniphilales bacterium]
MLNQEVKISSLEDLDLFTKNFADEVKELLSSGKDLAVLFKGGMAAGKTTCVKSLARALNVTETVASPSFVGIHEYSFEIDDHELIVFYHLDLYQVNLNLEAFFELMNREEKLFFAIEWSEKLSDEVLAMFTQKKDHIQVLDLAIEKLSDSERLIRYGYRNS